MIVLDANLILVSAVKDDRHELVLQQFEQWLTQGIAWHAPDLARYEAANGLARLIVASKVTVSEAKASWDDISLLPITYHTMPDGRRVIEIALQMKRQSAYDAAYIALAESLNAELWTLDGPLYRNAISLGFPVKLLT
jgi:predicted nucleic acid-binding protein